MYILIAMYKKLIWVCSPPASGKTYISMKLAENLKHVVYLDKDSLIPLSNVSYKIANEPLSRESPFFEKNIRNVEYEVILDIGYEALKYDDIVLINAPFSREVRDKEYVEGVRKKLKEEYNAKLIIIWVITSIPVVKKRMEERNSPRDVYKLKNWDSYIKSVDFSIPSNLNDPKVKDDLLLFNNDNDQQFNESIKRILDILEDRD